MAKQLENPFEIKIVITDKGTEVDVSAHYGVSCEYGSLGRKGLPIELTATQEQKVVDLAKNVILPQIKENEGME